MRNGGFTIIELIIVLIIVGLGMSLVAPRLSRDVTKARFKSDLKKVSSTLRYARSRAIFTGRKQSVNFNSESGEYWMEGKARMHLAEPGRFGQIKVVKFKDDDSELKRIDFNANGSTSGGTIAIAMGKDSAVIEVTPFDSRVVIK